ncbi:hypothetical protein ALC56_08336 [Trachymyrmex septentrionalis]|uniref:Uncharacterized protein n=1 Tax=Trachymyrmex septentrionalis TaxID=34720 RepID=A0A195FB65_9HYME|nr:hypothetical protein ALC56_08336 [Trachymyrmex septentrionalis]
MNLHKSNSEETNEDERSVCPLRILVAILKTHSEKLPTLLEIQFLNEFSLNYIPLSSFQPKIFIESMMKVHAECTTAILENPTYLRKLVYKYNSGEREEEYIFSNNMSFYIDIMTLCFLHIVLVTKVEYVSPAMNDLIAIMRKKYCVAVSNFGELLINEITEMKVVISYPSVFIDLLYNFNNKISCPAFKRSCINILREWNLINIFCMPWLALIIPVIESEYKKPLALLLAMAVTLDTHNKSSYVLYQRIVTFYTSEVFPRNLKLTMCVNWGIIYKKKNIYKFAPYFTKLRKKAINLIKSIKVNDNSLEYTLHQI